MHNVVDSTVFMSIRAERAYELPQKQKSVSLPWRRTILASRAPRSRHSQRNDGRMNVSASPLVALA